MAVVGVLSDSHGRAAATRAAVRLLRDAGATLLIHLGDLETEAVLDELVGHDAHVVFGNCDHDEAALARYAEHVGVRVHHPCGRLVVDGRSVVFTHGHLEPEFAGALLEQPDFLLHGHTHQVRDERVGRTRVVNPGALFRASRYTAALLEPAIDRLRILAVPRPD